MRYAVGDAEHGCCFDAAVLDTESGGKFPRRVAECADRGDADRIAALLNGADSVDPQTTREEGD